MTGFGGAKRTGDGKGHSRSLRDDKQKNRQRQQQTSRGVSVRRGEQASVGFYFEVDQAHDGGGKDYPGELVPVEEWKSEERGGGPCIDLREAEGEVGQEQRQQPPFAAPELRRLFWFGCHPVQEHTGRGRW